MNEFVTWVGNHITGDEKGQAQIYLDRLFQAFGHKGLLEEGGVLEYRVKKPGEDGGGTTFADCVFRPHVLIEMKKRGTKLAQHYYQAFKYWEYLVPNRPRYVVLCNFDEFWIYDFNTQLDTPVDKVLLSELPSRYSPLLFLLAQPEKPLFGNHHEDVTRKAADKLADCYNSLVQRKTNDELAQRFVLQVLVALFSEDIGLLKRYTVAELLDECHPSIRSYDLLGGLFIAMNSKKNLGGRYKEVRYFDGGIFAEPARLELELHELNLLKEAAKFDWSRVRPEIFGTLFEHSLRAKKRHAFGAHFTSPVDIMKIVSPTIVEPWRNCIAEAKSRKELIMLHERMKHYTVLDPACGSGNFLYIAYRELKRIESELVDRIQESSGGKVDKSQLTLNFVTPQNFYGLDIIPIAVEIAKVTMIIGRTLAIEELHSSEPTLPLDNLESNFLATDALIDKNGKPARWPRADAIIGNPPFLGAKRMKPELGSEYVDAIRKAYPEVPGMADYCVYWFRKTHDHLPDCTEEDPVAGRAGLVGTQNVRNNKSRIGGLEHIAETGTIIEAVDNQPWSGEANVHVSIANWIKTKNEAIVPQNKRLWYRVGLIKSKRKSGNTEKQFDIEFRSCGYISSSLSDRTDVSTAAILDCNQGFCYTGQYPRFNKGFLISRADAQQMLKEDPRNKQVIHPYVVGRELLTNNKSRFVIDFQKMPINDARSYKKPFKHIKDLVLPYVQSLANKEQRKTKKESGQDQTWLNTWWQHFRPRQELIEKITEIDRFIVCSRVTKRPIFMFLDSRYRPGDALSCFAFDDDYSFGILQSQVHWQWFVAKSSKLKSDFRYTPESVFDTFPWPQRVTAAKVRAVADSGREVRRLRVEALKKVRGGLRTVYQTLELPGKNSLKDAHAKLNDAVMQAYGFNTKEDILQQLLDLNISIAKRIDKDQEVVCPGIPKSYPSPSGLISDDRIKP